MWRRKARPFEGLATAYLMDSDFAGLQEVAVVISEVAVNRPRYHARIQGQYAMATAAGQRLGYWLISLSAVEIR